MSRWLEPAAVLAAAGLLVAACESSLPSTPSPSAAAIRTARATPSPSPSPSPSSPDFSSLVDLGLELDIHVLGQEHTDDMLDFVSDGEAVLFSSGAASDVSTSSGAPDLWRVEPGGEPEMVWKNPARDHSLAMIRGDLGTYAFVDIPLTGERAWTLHVIPRRGEEAIVLDAHPGDYDVPSFVPSISVYERQIVWTAFDRGPHGPVSQLLIAREPAWEPTLLLEYPAAEVEIWLPSFDGGRIAYTEVRYSEDRLSDERTVWLMDWPDPEGRRRLDTTGRATMPLIIPDAVLWKQAERGYNMFNWGHMYRYDLGTERVTLVDLTPQTFVNYASAGGRFAAWYGADSFQFGVHDHVLQQARAIERNPPDSDTSVLRPHLHEDLLVWLRVTGSDQDATSELRFAWLPGPEELRNR